MSSFYAELTVSGHTFPVRHCTYEFTQATGARGQVVAKVRYGLVHVSLDVPRTDALLVWAAAVHKPLAGHVTFFETDRRTPRETVSWPAGHCVGYHEEFVAGDRTAGAYVCELTITADKLVLSAGGTPRPFVAASPREHGRPRQGLLLVPPVLPPPPVVPPLVVPVAEDLAAVAARQALKLLGAAATPVALILALLVGSTTPAHAPGLPPVDPKLLRLRLLTAKHAAGTLTAAEEAELIDLLAKVKGIRVNKLSDLDVSGPLRGGRQTLPGFYHLPLSYTKRSEADLARLRASFAPVRKQFLEQIASNPATVKHLKAAGLTDGDIARAASGKVPGGYQVHHKLPLDDGGDNSISNLMLIKNDPYHLAITNLQNALTQNLGAGQTINVQWPMYDGVIYPSAPSQP